MNVRMPRPLLNSLDAWIAEQPERRPSRPELVRAIVAQWVASRPRS